MENLKTPIMLTIRETALKVNLPPYFIRQLTKQEKIKYVKAGKKFLINFQSLLNYLNTGDFEKETQTDNAIRKINERNI